MKKFILALAFLLFSATIADAQNVRIRRNRVVGYQPQIIWIPSGTYMRTGPVVVGPNRRYVRIGVNIGFSYIPQVNTFNYVNGRYRRAR